MIRLMNVWRCGHCQVMNSKTSAQQMRLSNNNRLYTTAISKFLEKQQATQTKACFPYYNNQTKCGFLREKIINNNNPRLFSTKVVDKDASKLPQEAVRKLVGTEVVDLSTSSISSSKSTQPSYFFQGYTSMGEFKVNDNVVAGPIIITKKMLLHWRPKNLSEANKKTFSVKDLLIEDFTLFNLLNPPIDLILLGTGLKIQMLNPRLLKSLREIAPIEFLDSSKAGSTFNMLIREDRTVACALLPIY